MDPIVAPPEHPHFTRQPTDCDQALQLNGGILPGNREDEVDRYFTRQPTDCDQALQPNGGILPGNREDEVEENCDWWDGYFMDRDTEPEEDPVVALPIIERPFRSLIEIANACDNSSAFGQGFSKCAQQRFSCGMMPAYHRSSPFSNLIAKGLNNLVASWAGVSNSDRVLDMVKSCVPELDRDRETLRAVTTTIREVQISGDIEFSLKYMAMSDTQMVREFAREAKRSSTGRYYVGITENPLRRLRMHADAHIPFMYMLIVRVAFMSSETASWEKLAIRYFREKLGVLALLNVGDGGERASRGIPHYGYILRCR